MRPAGGLAWCLAATLAAITRAHAQDPTRVVITRPQIEAAGWFTVGEVLTGATGWQRATLDAVWFLASADGLPAGAPIEPGEPEWLLLVDGQRVTADMFGAKLLELLPISPAQIESVTVTRVPRLAAGTMAARGVVELHTRRVPSGPALDAAWHSGNVTGDPGPYAFTPLAAQNVDRLGPHNYAVATFAGTGWHVAAGARQGSSHITHRGIRELFDSASFEQLGEHKWAPYDVVHVRASLSLLGARHDLVAGRGWVNGPLFMPLVTEQWLRGVFDHLGASGSIAAGAATLGYQLTRSALDVSELPTTFPFFSGHSRQRVGGVFEVGLAGDRGRRARLGAGVTRWSMDQGDASAARTEATLFANLTLPSGRSAYDLSGALARSSGGPITPKLALSAHVVPDTLTTLSVAFSYVQFTIGDDGTWIDRTLRGLDTLTRRIDERVWADLGLCRRLRPGLSADLGARVGIASDARVIPQVRPPDEPPLRTGGIAEVRAGLSLVPTSRLPVARVAYRYGTSLGPDSAMRAAVRATPAHVLEGNLIVVPARDLRFGAFGYIASRTRWGDFLGAPAAPGEPTLVVLPAIARLDVSAEKWFWRRRVRTQLLIRNLFDQPERYHPRGAELPLRAHITLALALPPT